MHVHVYMYAFRVRSVPNVKLIMYDLFYADYYHAKRCYGWVHGTSLIDDIIWEAYLYMV